MGGNQWRRWSRPLLCEGYDGEGCCTKHSMHRQRTACAFLTVQQCRPAHPIPRTKANPRPTLAQKTTLAKKPSLAHAHCHHTQPQSYIVGRLQAIPDIDLAEPQGAFYVLPDMSAYVGPGVTAPEFGAIDDVDALCQYLVEAANVALVPGDAFGAPSCIRISYAASMDTLKEAMDRLERALGRVARRKS